MLSLEFSEKKTPKKRKASKDMLTSRKINLSGDKTGRRPLSTGDITDKKVWRIGDVVFGRSRAATFSGSPSSFCGCTSTASCYNCLYDAAKGRQFCEIMGSSYCHQCIRASRRQDSEEEVSCFLGNDSTMHTRKRPSLAFPNNRNWFVRLNNLNSISDYYINPMDGVRTNFVSSRQKIACVSSSQETFDDCDRKLQVVNQDATTQNHWLRPRGTAQGTSQRIDGNLSGKNRETRTVQMKRKFITFTGLPTEPPLITVDLSNQIMNNLVVNDI